jgi:4-aminobutyrate aminotransferase/(S)-3-amino-2-methylpropionate transaminase
MLHTAPSPADVAATVRRHGGGGPRRIAESAGIVIERGEGSHLIDTDGRRYLDFATAMGVAAIGHGHPVWVERVSAQAARLSATVLHTREHAEYLERLAGFVPDGLGHVALYSGGAEAVEVAIRLAQSVSGHRDVLTFTTGFHGKTAGTRYTGGRFADERARLGVDWVHDVPYPLCSEHDAVDYPGCTDDGAAALMGLDAAAGRVPGVAAVIVEPVLGTAGNRPPQRGFLQALRRHCDANGWLLIVDESITGFGRLGRNFASDYFGVHPDILILGKAIGGGYPLSGVAASEELWNASLFAEMSATSSSYGANPMACAAGLAVLDILEAPGFLDEVTGVAAILAQGLRELAQDSPYVTRPRGAGMMLGYDLVDPESGELASADLCRELFRRRLDAGILTVGDVPGVRLNPPIVLTRDEAHEAIAALRAALIP